MKSLIVPQAGKITPPPRKPTRRPLARVLGDALLSLAVHAAVVFLLIRMMVAPTPTDASRQIEVTMEDQAPPEQLDPVQDLLEPAPEEDLTQPPPPEWASQTMAQEDVLEPQEARASEVLSIDSRLILPMLVDNGVTERQLKRGQGTQFGHGEGLKGDITGTMYDLKRDRAGSARACEYVKDVQHILAEKLGKDAFSGFYRVPRPLYLSHLFVPTSPAESGPAAFGVGDLMESRMWVVHYTGQVQTLQAGRYRFVGIFDDLLMVLIDGQVVHEFLWTGDPTPWEPKDYVRQHASFAGQPLVYGDWFQLDSMQSRRIDLLVGEHPGGKVGGVLLIQREGEDYATEANGRPILPIFALQPLTPDEEQKLASFPGMKFDPRIPVMGARSDWKAPATAARPQDEVNITIQ